MLHVKTLTVGQYETNCYILYQDSSPDCIVIDPGYEPERILQTVKQSGKTLSAILLTHGHFDHVGGVKEIFARTDCDIYLCPGDCQMPETMTAGTLSYTNSYADGDTLCLAGLNITVLQTPGHTPGSVCLICENNLFSGDTLFAGSCGRTDLPCGNWGDLINSLHKLKALPENYTVYPGHGESTTLSQEKQYNPFMR